MILDQHLKPLKFVPYVSADKNLPEITLKAFILSVILTVVMAGSNAYLGLKVGLTVSATIPAAVISMAVLRLFKSSNILENNIVQTAASAGEAIAAAVVFTIPALLVLGYWSHFSFWMTFLISIVGGSLGVLFSIPLRRAFIADQDALAFPEGIATAEVLKAGDDVSKGGAKELMLGGIIAAVVKVGQSALMIISESYGYWTQKGKVVFGFSSGFTLVLMGAGYIVGITVGLATLLGALFAWGVGVPLYSYLYGIPETALSAFDGGAFDGAMSIWKNHIRIMGVGTMVTGGVWTIIKLIQPIKRAVKSSFETFSHLKLGLVKNIERTEHDISMNYVVWGIVGLSIPILFIFNDLISESNLNLSLTLHWITVVTMTLFALIFGFLAAAIAGYLAGLVGSSNNPVSAVNIMGILAISCVLLILLGDVIDFSDTTKSLSAAAIAIVVTSVMSNTAVISGDNLQDLKSGYIVGATPWKQQVMLLVGVVVGGLSIAPILEILYEAYGIGSVFPRAGMDPAQALLAPTASVLGSLTQAVFTKSMNWTMFNLGAGIALIMIALEVLTRKSARPIKIPILGVAVGIYLPLNVIFPIFFGGLIAYLANRRMMNKNVVQSLSHAQDVETAQRKGLLFSSGLIAGEALIGIILAIPFAAYQSTQIFAMQNFMSQGMITILGIVSFFGTAAILYKIASKLENKTL